jgi:uncharacterized membrane protein YjjP (DUF1212 family)
MFISLDSFRQVVVLAAAGVACLILRLLVGYPWYLAPLAVWLAGFIYFAYREYRRDRNS